MTGITSLGHLALKVRDLEASAKFYRDQVGFAEMSRLRHDNGDTWLIYLRITDEQFLELMISDSPEPSPADGATGTTHFCFTIADLDIEAARLSANGIALTSPIKLGEDGNRGAWIVDPDGNRIELMEMSPDCIQYRAIRALKGS
ncbi:MAG: VOC family protein [Rhodobacteraceae bacterium]|nr:VOC family protein [Paracoccaceae bacterium]PHR53121.1 MAG: lactoylglutathione lyase [Robiginitomaculum sp.]